jgi:transposase
MVYVGLDMHTKHLAVCALNETGQGVRRARVRSGAAMLRLRSGLDERFEVGYEASCG